MVTPEKCVNKKKMNTMSSAAAKRAVSSIKKNLEKAAIDKDELTKSSGKQLQKSIRLLQNQICKVAITNSDLIV